MSRYLKEGYGSPYVEVYNGAGKLITVNGGLPLGKLVTDFNYEADEENDDSCRVTFESDLKYISGNLADHPSLQVNVMIQVKWGWQGNPHSQTRIVAIRDTLSRYTSTGFSHTLICTDKASYLKTVQTDVINTTNFVDWLKGIKSSNWQDIRTNFDIPKVNIKFSGGNPINIDTASPAYLNELTGFITTPIDNTAVNFNNNAIVPAGKSIFKVIREKMDEVEDGPYVVTGQDTDLDIRKRDFDQGIIRSYNLNSENGDDVISFDPETFIRKHDTELANYASTDPVNVTAEAVQEFDLDPKIVNPGFAGVYDSLDDRGKDVHGLLETLRTAYEDDPTLDPTDVLVNYTGMDNLGTLSTQTPDYVDTTNGIKAAVESTGTIVRGISIPRSMYWDSELAAEVLEKVIENQIKEDHFKKYQAQFDVQGDPGLNVNKCISISGTHVATIHKGKWYITRVRHQLSASGYTCNMTLLKCPAPISFVKSKWVDPLTESWGLNPTNKVSKGVRVESNTDPLIQKTPRVPQEVPAENDKGFKKIGFWTTNEEE